MLTLIRDGGAPIWFVLFFGGGALVVAARFAMKKAVSRALLRGLMWATLFATLSALSANLGATFAHVSQHLDGPEGDARIALARLLEGLGESMSSGIVGFSLLALALLLVGVGEQRREADTAA